MGNNQKSLNETEPISNERGWDKEMKIPERASLVGDEPARPKSRKENKIMTRMKETPKIWEV
jgi:hypothetical protein